MNQEYRRKFLALDTLRGDKQRMQEQVAVLIADVRSVPVDRWPYAGDVRDVLMSIGLEPAAVDELVTRYELDVWGRGLPARAV